VGLTASDTQLGESSEAPLELPSHTPVVYLSKPASQVGSLVARGGGDEAGTPTEAESSAPVALVRTTKKTHIFDPAEFPFKDSRGKTKV
jgi:hypothetical protein